MVRFFAFFVFIVPLFLHATPLDDKIESFLGKKEFYVKKNLIDILFANEAEYINADTNQTNDLKVLEKLKDHGLLKLFYNNPIKMKISFETKGNALIFMRVINESLEAMGYSYFLTDKVLKNDENFIWNIILSTEHIVDPILLSRELEIRGCKIEKIIKGNENFWSYQINSKEIKIDAQKLESNTTVKLKKPIRAYWVDLEDIYKISIRSKLADRWHPKVIFYDKSLKVVSYYTRDDVINFVKLDVPSEAKYVKIEDVYTLDNIKKGTVALSAQSKLIKGIKMFDEIRFNTIERLPNYVFAEINEIKLNARRAGEDIIDFSMGNPDGRTPQHIIDKLIESANKDKTHGYSASKGIYKLRLAICKWYSRKYGVDIDPDKEAVVTLGSKEGYVHLVQAITNPGDVAVVPDPAYPIHSHAFIIAGGNVHKMGLEWNEAYELDEDVFFTNLKKAFAESVPKPKYVLVNFPHNPTTVTVEKSFYERLVAYAKKERFYIISDIAYADLTFDGYKTPSIFEVEGAKDVAVESYTLSKSYNMAGWRVGFMVGNPKLIGALQKIKSWFDYGMFTPIQVASTIALDGPQDCVNDIIDIYQKRRDVLVESFANAGWEIVKPKSSMFVWAKIPDVAMHMGSMSFAKQLLTEAKIAVSPGIGFGEGGDKYVRIALIENENRIRQAARNLKKYLKSLEEKK